MLCLRQLFIAVGFQWGRRRRGGVGGGGGGSVCVCGRACVCRLRNTIKTGANIVSQEVGGVVGGVVVGGGSGG